MISLTRPSVPSVLKRRGLAEVKLLWKQHAKTPSKITAKQTVYSAREVKKALYLAQFGKCAYCEVQIVWHHPRVEHYRPKLGWLQTRGDSLTYPEYFWLSYDWDNLLLSCEMCNGRKYKQNLFPLALGSIRATVVHTSHCLEAPQLLNPYIDDVANHIKWNQDVPRGVSQRGRTTIELLGLDDQNNPLIDFRREHFHNMKVLLNTVEGNPSLNRNSQDEINLVLKTALTPQAPFSAMIRDNFEARINLL